MSYFITDTFLVDIKIEREDEQQKQQQQEEEEEKEKDRGKQVNAAETNPEHVHRG